MWYIITSDYKACVVKHVGQITTPPCDKLLLVGIEPVVKHERQMTSPQCDTLFTVIIKPVVANEGHINIQPLSVIHYLE